MVERQSERTYSAAANAEASRLVAEEAVAPPERTMNALRADTAVSELILAVLIRANRWSGHGLSVGTGKDGTGGR